MIGLSVNADKENQDAMKWAGAVGLKTKEAAVEELCDAMRQRSDAEINPSLFTGTCDS